MLWASIRFTCFEIAQRLLKKGQLIVTYNMLGKTSVWGFWMFLVVFAHAQFWFAVRPSAWLTGSGKWSLASHISMFVACSAFFDPGTQALNFQFIYLILLTGSSMPLCWPAFTPHEWGPILGAGVVIATALGRFQSILLSDDCKTLSIYK